MKTVNIQVKQDYRKYVYKKIYKICDVIRSPKGYFTGNSASYNTQSACQKDSPI